MYHEDRLGGGGFSRVVLAGASMAGAEQAERLRRGIEERVGGRVELFDVRTAAAMRDRISAESGAARRARGARRRAAARASRRHGASRAGGVMLRTNLSTRPFYNERAVHLVLGLVALVVLGADGRQPRQRRAPVAAEHGALGASMREDRATADELTRKARQTRQEHQSGRAQGHRRGRARGQRPHRRAHVLVDGALQPARVDAAAGCDARVGQADDRRRTRRRSRWSSLGRRSADLDEFMEKLEATGAVRERAAAAAEPERRRADAGDDRRRCTCPTPRPPSQPALRHPPPKVAAPPAKTIGVCCRRRAMTLFRRVLAEKRGLIYPLVGAVLVERGACSSPSCIRCRSRSPTASATRRRPRAGAQGGADRSTTRRAPRSAARSPRTRS